MESSENLLDTISVIAAICGIIVGAAVTFVVQLIVQSRIDNRERLFHTLNRLERAQLASQRLSSLWRQKIRLFDQKAENEPFIYLNDSVHPGDEKFEVQFLINAFLPNKLENEIVEIDQSHKKLKKLFEDADDRIRSEAVKMVGRIRRKEVDDGHRIITDMNVTEIAKVENEAIQMRDELDKAIAKFKIALLQEIRRLAQKKTGFLG